MSDTVTLPPTGETPNQPTSAERAAAAAAELAKRGNSGVPPVADPAGEPAWLKGIDPKHRRATAEETLAAVAASYSELQSHLGKPKGEPKAEPEAEAPITNETLEFKKEEAAVEPPKVSPGLLRKAASGDEAAIKSLQTLGFTDSDIQDATQAYKAIQKVQFMEAASIVGGTAELKRIVTEVNQTLGEAEVAALNQQVANADKNTLRLIMLGLKAQYPAKAPSNKGGGLTEPTSLAGGNGTKLAPFKSEAEFQAALRSPQYKTDPAYRQEVMLRRKVS